MKISYLFIGGCPRSGTSLLSALIGNVTGVGVVQDLCLLFYLKLAALQLMLEADGVSREESQPSTLNICPFFDLRQTELLPRYLSSSLVEVLNSYGEINGSLFRLHLAWMDKFLFESLNKPDPRKDRGQGSEYLQRINFPELLSSPSMTSALLDVLRMSARPLSAKDSRFSEIDIVCDKTPENLVSLDLIDACFEGDEYRFIHLVRDPVSVFGARRQRLINQTPEAFVSYFKAYSRQSFSTVNCASKAIVRYEDLLANPVLEIKRIFDELSLSSNRCFDALLGPIVPGKYVNYVGSSIDPCRDMLNRSKVSDVEKSYIYEHLSEFSEEFSYGRFGGS